jgi:CheY-like chemotaxis protein
MARKGYCSYCRSVQPLGEYHEEGQAALWCETCRNPIESSPLEKPAARPRSPTVLCIDDDRMVLSYCSDALERHGFRTLVAADGPSGIEIAKRDRPDVILLDVMMPGVTGLDVCRQLRTEPGLRHIPVILLTASDDPALDQQGREAGATSTMRKPFGTTNIVDAIEQVLERRIGPQDR